MGHVNLIVHHLTQAGEDKMFNYSLCINITIEPSFPQSVERESSLFGEFWMPDYRLRA